jgi:hypothetical protein
MENKSAQMVLFLICEGDIFLLFGKNNFFLRRIFSLSETVIVLFLGALFFSILAIN